MYIYIYILMVLTTERFLEVSVENLSHIYVSYLIYCIYCTYNLLNHHRIFPTLRKLLNKTKK